MGGGLNSKAGVTIDVVVVLGMLKDHVKKLWTNEQMINNLLVEKPIPPYEVPSGDIQSICSPSIMLLLVMYSIEESQGAPVTIGGSLTAMIPGMVAQLPEVILHAPLWFSVMLHEVDELTSFHTVLFNGLPASSHVHVTILLMKQKLSHTRETWPVG